MEIPSEVRNLYRHLDLHTSDSQKSLVRADIPDELRLFIEERVAIWQKKTQGKPQPYTKDPILAKYRFCNVLRELDRQTIHFHGLLNPLRDDLPGWLLNMFYCRMVARPQTVSDVGLLSFDNKNNQSVYDKLTKYPRPKYGTPYIFPAYTTFCREPGGYRLRV